MMRWLGMAGLLVLLGCAGGINPRPPFPTPRPTPTPTPTPEPTPIPPCLPAVPWCSDLTPPAQCSSATVPCKHNPTQDPYHCELAPACPETPIPEPPKPTPPPGQSCDGEVETNTGQKLNSHADAVDQAMKTLTGCEIGSACPLGNKPLQVWNREVIGVLRRAGLCAGQHEPQVTDEIAVAGGPRQIREAYHIGAGDDGSGAVPPGGARRTVVWSRGAVREAWTVGPGTEPPPTAEGCTTPVAPKVNKFGLKAHQRTNDSTPQFYNGEAERWDGTKLTGYCDAIGFVNRLHCPARMECGEVVNPKAVKCNERVACEALGVSGRIDGKPLWRSDGTVHLSDNPFQATCKECTWLEICAADGTACQRCAIDAGTGLCF